MSTFFYNTEREITLSGKKKHKFIHMATVHDARDREVMESILISAFGLFDPTVTIDSGTGCGMQVAARGLLPGTEFPPFSKRCNRQLPIFGALLSPTTCQICGGTADTGTALKAHLLQNHIHLATPCENNGCGDYFFTKLEQEHHMKNSHNIKAPYKCVECGKTFNSTDSRTAHYQRFHQGDVVCAKGCGLVFKGQTKSKESHERFCGLEPEYGCLALHGCPYSAIDKTTTRPDLQVLGPEKYQKDKQHHFEVLGRYKGAHG
jgi:hypothetical protein